MNRFSYLLFLSALFFPLSVSAQALAQKLPDLHKAETQSHCGEMSFWVKGHWEWDRDKKDYLWVSGHCKAYRPGYTYIPGRWVKVPEGWVWQEGVWKKI